MAELPMQQIGELLIIVIGWAAAYYGWDKKAAAEEGVAQTVEYFTTGNAPAPATVQIPERAYKMKQSTKDWLIVSETEADKISILKQVEEAEAAGKTEYTIVTSRGYYQIEWGALIGSGKFGQ